MRDGGRLAADTLLAHGVEVVFTLSGGHLFPLYDGCVKAGVELVDTRHEQTAVFAAEGWAKVTRRPSAAALTAGPGVTNGVSAVTAAWMNGSPLVVIGGRAPQARWGNGSLQELDHVPILAPVTKRALTIAESGAIPTELDAALSLAAAPHRGPVFVDIPLDAWGASDADVPERAPDSSEAPDPDAVAAVAALVDRSERPVLVVGGDVYWAHGEDALRAFAEVAQVPVFANGMGRGLLPADHELAFSRARSHALKHADLVVVAGTPLDFRLGFGAFGAAAVVHLCDASSVVAQHVDLAASTVGDLALTFGALVDATSAAKRVEWLESLRDAEQAARALDRDLLDDPSDPIRPARVYGELLPRLDRDAIVIGDGGDFVSYAGRFVDSYVPGSFLDPGSYGCLGVGAGFALAAGLAHRDRQVVALFGDGAIGFSLGDLDSLVRHDVNMVAIIGNNGIWGLEKHPMQMIFGYDVVAELRPGTRYDLVAAALGAHGELVSEPHDLGPALDRAFATRGLSVVNVLTDPADAYPRSSNLG